MKKLTKHKSFESLKLSGHSNATTGDKASKPIPEVEDFLNQLRQEFLKNRKPKIDKL